MRLYREICNKFEHSDWQHVEFIEEIHDILTEALQEISYCEYPLYSHPRTAGVLVRMHQFVAPSRIKPQRCALGLPPNSETKMQDYNSAALRDINDDYRRNLWQFTVRSPRGQ